MIFKILVLAILFFILRKLYLVTTIKIESTADSRQKKREEDAIDAEFTEVKRD